MGYNKNVVEEALFQIRNLEETLQDNAKGILQSTMRARRILESRSEQIPRLLELKNAAPDVPSQPPFCAPPK